MFQIREDFNLSCVLVHAVSYLKVYNYCYNLIFEYFKTAMEKRMNVLKQAQENIGKAQEKQKKDYDKRHHDRDTFKVGSLVLRKDMTRKKRKGGKLDTKWTGPFKTIASLGHGLYQLSHYNNPEIVIPHVNGIHLKKYNHPSKSLVSCIIISIYMIAKYM